MSTPDRIMRGLAGGRRAARPARGGAMADPVGEELGRLRTPDLGGDLV